MIIYSFELLYFFTAKTYKSSFRIENSDNMMKNSLAIKIDFVQ